MKTENVLMVANSKLTHSACVKSRTSSEWCADFHNGSGHSCSKISDQLHGQSVNKTEIKGLRFLV